MKKINKIMAAIDLSSYSLPIMQYAIKVAQNTNAEIIVLNVLNLKGLDAMKKLVESQHLENFYITQYLENEVKHRTEMLESLIKECKIEPMPPVRIIIREGVPITKILDVLDEENADFLIFGPKGKTNLPGFLFGTVAEKLFRHSPVPVLSFRTRP